MVHLAANITKRPIFHAIINLILPREAVFVLQCSKVFVVQVDQAAEAEVHRHLKSLEHSRATAFPSPPPTSNLRYLHYLQQLTEALEGRPPKGFRFAVTKEANAPGSYGDDGDHQWICEATAGDRLDELLPLCQEWAGHRVIDAFKNYVSETRTRTQT